MREDSEKAVTSPRRGNSRSRRCLRVEHLESRTLLSAAPWTPQAPGPEMPVGENLEFASMELVPDQVGPGHGEDITPNDRFAQHSGSDLQPLIPMVPPVSKTHFMPSSKSEPFHDATNSAPLNHQIREDLTLQPMAPHTIAPPIDSGMPTQPVPAGALERGDVGMLMPETLEMPRDEWVGIPEDASGMTSATAYLAPPPPRSVSPNPFEGMGAELAGMPLSAMVPGGYGTPWDGERKELPPQPQERDPFAARGFYETLAGIGVLDSLVTSVSADTTESISLANAWYAGSESLLQLSAELDQAGDVAPWIGQNTGETSAASESPHIASWTYSLTAGTDESTHFSTLAALDSDLDAPLGTLSTFKESVTSPLDDQNGGLIDIDAEPGPAVSRDASPSWQAPERFSIETLLDRKDWLAHDEDLPDEDAKQDQARDLADAAIASDWEVDSEEGGMIELAAADSRDVHSHTSAVSASESGMDPWRDIRIEKGLRRFRALEVAEATSEHQEDRALTQQATEQDLSAATTTSSEKATPEVSASAATEPQAETDHHAAAAPAIIGLSLMSGAQREKSKKSLVLRHTSE